MSAELEAWHRRDAGAIALGSIGGDARSRRPGVRIRNLRGFLVTSTTALVAAMLVWFLVLAEMHSPRPNVDWRVFGIIAVLLIASERSEHTWIRFGPIGVVTPLWMFSYALMLLGSPAAAVAVALVGAAVHAFSHDDLLGTSITRVAGTAISLSSAGMVLRAFGVRDSITTHDTVPWDWAFAIVAAGVTIIVLNTLVSAVTMSVRRKLSFVALTRRGFGVRVTAEGALVSLAPLWVIGIDFSVVLLPLLGITTVLVFRSTRQALERSHEAHHDQLTGLLNRGAFLDQLGDALGDKRTDRKPSLLIMDLDGFKQVNDRLGHQMGDALLVSFADRLERSLPVDAIACRLGGDEFAVLMSAPPHGVSVEVEHLHAALSDPLVVEGFPVTVGVSIGVATAPSDGKTTRDLLRAADVAMYRAKRTNSRFETYDNCVKVPQRGRLNLLGDLSQAIDEQQFHVHFQPQIRMRDGTVDTVEALIRWHHPEHGPIPPNEFIGLAEQTDLIGPITEAVFRAATGGLLMTGTPRVKLAINVSARSLQGPNFADEVFAILRETGFPPDRLEIEVTERAIVDNPERTTFTIAALREAGVRLAIDDFGTGHSSYQTLRVMQVDRVKIDRDFVQGLLTQPRDRHIVSSLIGLAHALDLDVVAEGVESTRVWDELVELGCDIAQGYGIAVPMRWTELHGWLQRWNATVPVGSAQTV
jgi:diguanylate cyclase (GGDEF)-like protein